MDEFQTLLRRLPNSGSLRILCAYNLTDNERNRLPGATVEASVTLSIQSGEYPNFLDWMRTDDTNSLAPTKFTWTNYEATVILDLVAESMEVRTENRQLLRTCMEYSQEVRLRHFNHVYEFPARERIARRAPIDNPRNPQILNPQDENWDGNIMG